MTSQATGNGVVGILWDYENVPVPKGYSGYGAVQRIRDIALQYGTINLFKAYLQVNGHATNVRAELQISGVSLTDTPHVGYKDVADQMLQVDMLVFAWDNPPPTTIVLISGDRDFAYAAAILRNRNFRIVIITLAQAVTCLREQATQVFDWRTEVLGTSAIPKRVHPSLPPKRPAPGPSQQKATVRDKAALARQNIDAWQYGTVAASSTPANWRTAQHPAGVNEQVQQARSSASSVALTIAARALINSRLVNKTQPSTSVTRVDDARAQASQLPSAPVSATGPPQPATRTLPHEAVASSSQPQAQRFPLDTGKIDLLLSALSNGGPEQVLSASARQPETPDVQIVPQSSSLSDATLVEPSAPAPGIKVTAAHVNLLQVPQSAAARSRSPSVVLLEEGKRDPIVIPIPKKSKNIAQCPAQASSGPSLSSSSMPLQAIVEEEVQEPPRSPSPPPTPMEGVESECDMGEADMDLDSSLPPSPTRLHHDKGSEQQKTEGPGRQPEAGSSTDAIRDSAELARQKAVEIANRLTASAKAEARKDQVQGQQKAAEGVSMDLDIQAPKPDEAQAEREQAIAREREAAARAREAAAAYVLKKAAAPPTSSQAAGPSRQQARRPSLYERLTSPEGLRSNAVDRHYRPERGPSPGPRRQRSSRSRSPSPMLVDGRQEYRRPPLQGTCVKNNDFGDDVIWMTGDETYWERVSRGAWDTRNARSRSRSASPKRRGGSALPPRSPSRTSRAVGKRRASVSIRERTPPRGRSRTPTARARSSSPMGSPMHRPPPARSASTLHVPTGPRARSRSKSNTPFVPPQVAKKTEVKGRAPPQFVKATVTAMDVTMSSSGATQASAASQPAPGASKWKPLKEIVNVEGTSVKPVSASSWVSAMAAGQTPAAPSSLPSKPAPVTTATSTTQPSKASAGLKTLATMKEELAPKMTTAAATKKASADAVKASTTTATLQATTTTTATTAPAATSTAAAASEPRVRFKPLIQALQAFLAEGKFGPSRSVLAIRLMQFDKDAYVHAGLRNFKQYIEVAAQEGIVYEGIYQGVQWVALEDEWTEVKI
ncbi:NYN domain-containing protein [Schizophyllum commune]